MSWGNEVRTLVYFSCIDQLLTFSDFVEPCLWTQCVLVCFIVFKCGLGMLPTVWHMWYVTVPFVMFVLKITLQYSRCWKNFNWLAHVPHNIISLMKRYRQVHISFAVCRIVVTWPVYFCFRQIPSEQLSIYFKWCKCSNHGNWVASRFVTSQTHFTTVSSTHLS